MSRLTRIITLFFVLVLLADSGFAAAVGSAYCHDSPQLSTQNIFTQQALVGGLIEWTQSFSIPDRIRSIRQHPNFLCLHTRQAPIGSTSSRRYTTVADRNFRNTDHALGSRWRAPHTERHRSRMGGNPGHLRGVHDTQEKLRRHAGAKVESKVGIPVVTLETTDPRVSQIIDIIRDMGPHTVLRIINAHLVSDVLRGKARPDVFIDKSPWMVVEDLQRDGYPSRRFGLPQDRSAILVFDAEKMDQVKSIDRSSFMEATRRKDALLGVIAFTPRLQPYEAELAAYPSREAKIAYLQERISKASTSQDLEELRYIAVTVSSWLYDEGVKLAEQPAQSSLSRISRLVDIFKELSENEKMIEKIEALARQIDQVQNAYAEKDTARLEQMQNLPALVIQQATKILFETPDMLPKFRELLLKVKVNAIRTRVAIAQDKPLSVGQGTELHDVTDLFRMGWRYMMPGLALGLLGRLFVGQEAGLALAVMGTTLAALVPRNRSSSKHPVVRLVRQAA